MNIISEIAGAMRSDGWSNVVLGLGGTKDPSAYSTFAQRAALPDSMLEALYVEDHFAARIVEAKPKEAMRPGWELVVPGDPAMAAQVRDAYAAAEQALTVREDLAQGAVWGRLFGGAVTWIGADDGALNPEQPLNESAIRAVRFLHTYDKRDVQIVAWYRDPLEPWFGRPKIYRLSSTTPGGPSSPVLVHESRVVAWGGQITTDQRRTFLNGWDDSVLERCWDALRAAGENYGALSLLLGRISQAVYKIKGLYGMIAGKQEALLEKRISMLDTSRSRARAIVIDQADEDFVNVTQSVGGVELLVDRGVLRLSAAAEMPVTVLMGQSPAGLNATGASDLELWYASVEQWRDLELRARHKRVAKLILLAKNGPTGGKEPEKWDFLYRPLRVPTATESAALDKTRAETDAIEIDKGIVPPEAVALARHTGMGTGRVMLDEAEVKAALQRRRELASAPPKDNAELGTVGARATGQMDIIERVATGRMSRESGVAILMQTFRLKQEDAETMLGPKDFKPVAKETSQPGAPAAPPQGFGAGAPQPQPGQDQGGRPKAGE